MQENKIRIRFVINDKEAMTKLGNISKRIAVMGDRLTSVGTAMTKSFTIPIVGAFALAVKSSEELQKALEPIKTEAAAISKEFGDALAPVIRDLMPDIKTVLGYVSDLVRKFSELDSDSKERIVKLAVVVAALGPILQFVVGPVMTFIGTLGMIGSTLGIGGAATGAGAAVAGGGVTAAVAGFGTALTGVILPLTAVIGLAIVLYKWLDKLGMIKAAGQTIKDLGGIARYAIGSTFAPNADPGRMSAYVTGGMTGLQNYASQPTGVSYSSTPTGTYYRGGQAMVNGQPISITVQANSVVGTSKDLAAALRPAIYEAFRQLGLAAK